MTQLSFAYTAADGTGHRRKGRVEADSSEGATQRVRMMGLYPIEVRELRTIGAGRPAISPAELALGLRILADLVESGLPIARALGALELIATPRWTALLPSVRQGVHDGESLGRALERAPVAIPEVVIGIIHAGERGSGLGRAIGSAAALSQQTADTRAAIRGALAYPILLATAGVASAALLVGVVLPRFADILTDMGQALPASTRFVLAAGALARAGFVPGVLVVGVLLLARHWYLSTTDGRASWHALLLGTPLVGDTRAAAATSRLCVALAALLDAGIPVASALPHAARATADAALERRVQAARTRVVQGERLSDALAGERAVSAVAVRLIRTGEESGRLASLLVHAGRLEGDRATQRVQAMVRIIEPVMILGFGGGIALVAASLLQALYGIRPGG